MPLYCQVKTNTVLTLGVGGRPLEVALGGEVARLFEEVRSLRRGGGWGEPEPFSLNTGICNVRPLGYRK